MSVFKTAYDTRACNGFVMKKTVEALQVASANGHLQASANSQVRQVQGGASFVDAVPAFGHPLLLESAFKEQVLCLDVRQFGKWDQNKFEFQIRNGIEYNIAMHRANLNQIWIDNSPTLLRDISALPMSVYASWISESIARRYALDPREQLSLAILAAVFYNSLFSNDTALTETDRLRAVNAITRNLRASAKDVVEVMDQFDVISGADAFCAAAATVTKSVRLAELNVGVLFTILGGTWYGTNAKEMTAVALEHPPTWIAILMAAYTERTFKNSTLARITEHAGSKDSGKDFLRSVLNLISVTSGG